MIDFKKIKRVHFTGIKGVGMTSLALCFADIGVKISGSDVSEVFVTDEILKKRKIIWKVGFDKRHLSPLPDLLVTTGAHGGLSNPEVIFAKLEGIPVMTHAQALAEVASGKDTIAVCGVGGKTTTSSMISVLLESAGHNPSYAVGVGNIYPLNTPGRYNQNGKEFVCEADEFAISPGVDNRPRFSLLSPKIVIVTNIEHDHPDIYPTLADTKKCFSEFLSKVPEKTGLLVASIDNKNVLDLVKKLKVQLTTYGFSKDAKWRIKSFSSKDQTNQFLLNGVRIRLKVPGMFNVQNATAAFIVGKFLGLGDKQIVSGLLQYKGCNRRFEKMGEAGGILFYDDYAHHPTEIVSTLKACREWFPRKRIVVIFQPHTYSRTKALFGDFSRSFSDADVVGFMDIYASARETEKLGVSSQILVKNAQKFHSSAFYLGSRRETIDWIVKNTKRGDVLLTMGAGDIFKIHKEIQKRRSDGQIQKT